MFVTLKDKDNKTVHTHTSLIEEDREARIKTLYQEKASWGRIGGFIGFYLGMEAVNRIKPLAHLQFPVRAGIVAAHSLLHYYLFPSLWWKSVGDREFRKQLNGAPIYDEFFEVPELDKLYFWLDDDNNYEPSLWHHSTTKIQKPKRFYTYTD